jgi:microcompartment protein CcmL/EutN
MAVALSKHQITPRPRENINTLVRKKNKKKKREKISDSMS